MNNLLIWPLTETDKIIFSSSKSSLATITCCDTIDLLLYVNKAEFQLVSDMTGCQLSSFKNDLVSIVNKTKNDVVLGQKITISCSKLGQILISIQEQSAVLAYFIIATEIVQAWIAQLDLLEVVMQENENEKNSRGTGCC